MDEERMRQIAKEVYDSNQTSNQFSISKIPSHVHNGTDSNKIPIQNIQGVSLLPVSWNPSATELFSRQLTEPNDGVNGSVFSIPLPTLENASGDPFVLGEAPNGTLMLGSDITTLPPTVYLFARVGGLWYSTTLS
jgi:hypothetical protein